jgi:leader peptidase (prepilin peptidase)/N-methyltransferase
MMTPVLFAALAFLAGLLIGSFLNVCIYRLPRDLSVINPPRSFCPECDALIAWWDNIPLLSFLLLRGKCRNCKTRIPWRYPIVELATGLAFATAAILLGPTLSALKLCVFWAILIDLIATDFEERILPDEFTKGGMVVGIAFSAFVMMDGGLVDLFFSGSLAPRWRSVGDSLVGAMIPSFLIWFVGWLYEKIRHREGMGLGDVKMIGTVGAFIGLTGAITTLMLGSLFGVLGAGGYALITKKDVGSYELPFGSFLGLAAMALSLLDAIHKGPKI